MARFITQIPTTKTPEQVNATVQEYMGLEGFSLTEHKGQMLWKKGNGFVSGPQYIFVVPLNNGMIQIEAFIKFAILPGVYAGEMGITGFFGAIPKGMLRTRVDNLVSILG